MRLRAREDPDGALVERFRDGDERAFVELVARHHASMLRLARTFVASPVVAEEVVQDTWLGVLRGIDRFAGRSTFRTWLFAILANRARTTGVRERREIPLELAEPAVAAARFDPAGAWSEPPLQWADAVDDRLDAGALAGALRAALDALPARQRAVVLLRDVDGLTSAEVCRVLEISEANQRVLLHRGRSHLRGALEEIVASG
ncbi:MAG TPA: RNA polymerase sigma factor [Solirubrobacteraceae bacterium]|nr:RNA polymerase sigma factor [Solirubrobacteraceae bacterium]